MNICLYIYIRRLPIYIDIEIAMPLIFGKRRVNDRMETIVLRFLEHSFGSLVGIKLVHIERMK